MRRMILTGFFLLLGFFQVCEAWAGQLYVATASTDITPKKPIAISGQFNLRIARKVETPLTANVAVLETRDKERMVDMAIMVSCDLVDVPTEVLHRVRELVAKRLPDLDTRKIFLSGTHTHTAPVVDNQWYLIPKTGVMQVEEYRDFLVEQIAEAITIAWNGRSPGSFTWGLSHAVVGYNRRASYANGSSLMYGRTDLPEFRGLEGYEDHDIGTLFFWDGAGKLIGIVVNVACPSQEVENRTAINADFWHPTREALRKRFGADVRILGWAGAAGDQSPHLMYRKAADERMRRLRGVNTMEEIARRLDRAVEEAFEVVQNDRHKDIVLQHQVENIRLPMRLVTESEYVEAKKDFDQVAEQIARNPKMVDQVHSRMKWVGKTVERFENQRTQPNPTYETEIHVLRIGDVVVCTNPFELFVDYGIRIKARSKAGQTFLVQLAGPCTYLPTEKAIRGGHYSAVVHSGLVGPEGGQILVDRTVVLIDSLWAKK